LDRRLEVLELYSDPEIPDHELARAARAKLSWKDWAVHEYLTYWIVLGAVLLDLFIISEIIYIFHVKGTVGGLAIVFIAVALLVVEWYLYDKYRPKSPLFKKRLY
jgi:hypothetical protein